MNPVATARPDISILIVNWNSQAFVRDCLESIYKNAGSLVLEIIVVDNASFDGCDRMVHSSFPDTIFIQSELNVGFAGANNLAFAHSTGRNILFLNPDTEVHGTALESMLAVLHSQRGIGMVGARLLNSDLSLQDNCITALPTIANQALGSNFLRARFPQSTLWGKQAFFAAPERPAAVEAISGACMLAKREVIEAVGCFTTEYFMYCEDMDLCVKIAKAGWTVHYAPAASVVHHAGGSSAARDEIDFSSIMIRESLVKYFRLHRGAVYAALYRASSVLASSLRLLLLLAVSPAALHPAMSPRVSRAFRKWINIWAWSIGMTTWAARPPAKRIASQTLNGQVTEPLP